MELILEKQRVHASIYFYFTFVICFQKQCRHNKNKYFSEIHTKGLTVVALDLQSLKELTKDNLCESVAIGSSDKSGRVKTNVDTSNGNLNEDYLPSPKSLEANLPIEISYDMAQLENCLNVIQESLEASIENSHPKIECNKVEILKGTNTHGNNLQTLHSVSLQSLHDDSTEIKAEHSTGQMNPDDSSDCKSKVKDSCVESQKVETFSMDKSKVANQKSPNERVTSRKETFGNSQRFLHEHVLPIERIECRGGSEIEANVNKNKRQFNSTTFDKPEKYIGKENLRVLGEKKHVANGNCTMSSKVSYRNFRRLLANGTANKPTSIKANGYMTINEENYIEISYDCTQHELTHSKQINGNLPNGKGHPLEDSPSNKYRGRGSQIYKIIILVFFPSISSPRLVSY